MYTTRLSARVLIITGDFLDEHMTILDTGDGLVVIDTLATMPATRAALPHIRGFSDAPVRVVVNTHLDADHTAGNHLFPGATIVCHANGRRHLAERIFDDPSSEREIRAMVAGLEASASGGNTDPRVARYVAMYRSLLDGFGDYVFAPPTLLVAGGSCVSLGGTVLELHHFGPAHTDADLMVWIPEERLLLAGDAIAGSGVAPAVHAAHGGSVLGMAETNRQVRRLVGADTRIVPGHGAVGGLELIEQQQAYIDALTDAVRKARASGHSLDEAKQSVQVEAFSRHLLYDFVQPGHVELAWREAEQRDSLVAG